MKPYIIVTRVEALEALLVKRELPMHYLQRRFKEEHNLDFSIEEISSGKPFVWIASNDGFKITVKEK